MSKQSLPVLKNEPCCTPLVREPLTADWAGDLARMFKALGDPVRLQLLSRVASHAGGGGLCVVARPEQASLAEAQRASTELRALGMGHQCLIVNGLFTATPGTDDTLAAALHAQARHALATMPGELAGLPRTTVALRPLSPIGISELRRLAENTDTAPSPAAGCGLAQVDSGSFHDLIDTIAAAGAGLVMTMGKGGVGKTTVAAAVAVALAERGHRVQLTTTDPAAHVADAVGSRGVQGLSLARIDPVAETVAYIAQVLATAGAELDDGARAVLTEDLASPCTQEIAVFQAFARTVAAAQDSFVVVDTAPTGHTLLLLDAARTYHRELARQSGQMPEHVLFLLDRLRDSSRTHVLLAALPEATPVHEAARLQVDLARTGITPRAWVINQSLTAAAPTDPLLAARAASEHRYLTEVANILADRLVVLPRVAQAPVGAAGLCALVVEPVHEPCIDANSKLSAALPGEGLRLPAGRPTGVAGGVFAAPHGRNA